MPSRKKKASDATPVLPGQPAASANVRVRSRLLLIMIPTLVALILGGSRIVASVQSALAYQRVEQLAAMSHDVTGLTARLEGERDQTLQYIGEGAAGRAGMLAHNAAGGAALNLQLVQQDQNLTSLLIEKVRADAAGIGSGYPAQVRTDARSIGSLLKLLPTLRRSATTTQLPQTQVVTQYAAMINQLLAIDDTIALDSGDQALNNDVRALNLVSQIGEEASQDRGLLAYAFAQDGIVNPQVLSAVTTARAEENANIAEYDRVAAPAQVSLFNRSVSHGLADFANNYELQAIQYGQEGRPLSLDSTTSNEWYGAMTTGTIGGIDAVQQKLVAATISRASALRRQAILTAIGAGAAVLIVLLVAPLLIKVVGRSMATSQANGS